MYVLKLKIIVIKFVIFLIELKLQMNIGDSIGGLIAKHREVIAACSYAIDNNLIDVGLNKIISNAEYEYWIRCMNGINSR